MFFTSEFLKILLIFGNRTLLPVVLPCLQRRDAEAPERGGGPPRGPRRRRLAGPVAGQDHGLPVQGGLVVVAALGQRGGRRGGQQGEGEGEEQPPLLSPRSSNGS